MFVQCIILRVTLTFSFSFYLKLISLGPINFLGGTSPHHGSASVNIMILITSKNHDIALFIKAIRLNTDKLFVIDAGSRGRMVFN